MFGNRGGAVGIPRWVIGLRVFQLLLALLIIALTAYGLSVYNGGPIRTPLVAMIVIAVLTVVPILILVTSIPIAQRKMYDLRISLLLDLFALLFWLAALTALASYLRIFKYYGRNDDNIFTAEFDECRKCRRAYRSAIAATVFAAFEFLLFLITTLLFIYYHHEIAGTRASEFGRHGIHTKDDGAAVGATAAAGTHSHGTNYTTGTYEGEGRQMSSLPHDSTTTNSNHVTETAGTYGMTGTHVNIGTQQSSTIGQHTGPPYPDQPHHGEYGGLPHASQGAGRYVTNPNSNVV